MTINENDGRSLAELVAESITEYIISNQMQPGEKIPNETRLTELLGVGRSSVREAIKILVSRNILEIRRGDGTYVSERLGVVDDPLGLAFSADKVKTAWDLFNLRLLLEPWTARMAARNADEEQIRAIYDAFCADRENIQSGKDHRDSDVEFHRQIALSSGNSVISKIIPIISSGVKSFAEATDRELLEATVDCHRRIVEAIARHDEDSAVYAMEMHLIMNRNEIQELIRKES